MTRLRIEHHTRYDYVQRVSMSYNEARMSPLTDSQQVVLESNVFVAPHLAGVATYRDYWGTRVTSFDMQAPHEYLDVRAVATVEVHRSDRIPAEDEVLGWEDLASETVLNDFSDWLPQSRLSEPGSEVRERAAELKAALNPYEAAHAVFAWMKGEMQYVKGVTGVHFKAEDAWNERKGVCQDLAHVAIGALRSLGIPARYVSGYIHPRPTADVGEEVEGQSHAWLEWWDGEWHSWDPTNHKPAGDFHVSVARGRDYRDVPPLKGILSGGGGSSLQVKVGITRLA